LFMTIIPFVQGKKKTPTVTQDYYGKRKYI